MCQQHQHGDNVASISPQYPAVHGTEAADRFPWDVGVFDAHCHPTDTMSSIASVPHMSARALTVMSTRSQDQDLVSAAAQELGVADRDTLFSAQFTAAPRRIIPSFGWHPWFSYQLYDDTVANPTYDGTAQGKAAHYDRVLQPAPSSKDASFSAGLREPRPLSEFIEETRARLVKHPFALVGEIGLDKAFRLPQNWTQADSAKRDDGLTPGGREDRRLSPFRVSTEHQNMVLKAQLRLAGEMNRAVSVHGVQVHGGVYNVIAECWKGHEKEVRSRRQRRRLAGGVEKASDLSTETAKPFPPRICLHSYSGPVNILQSYIQPSVPAKVFFSFSTAVNWGAGGGDKTEEVIRIVPDDRILVESDLHVAGERMDQALEDVCRRVCRIKGWDLREGLAILAKNWRSFVFDEEA